MKDTHGSIDTGHEALHSCLLVAGRTIKLAAGEETVDVHEFEVRAKLGRIDAVILDSVGISDDVYMLEALHGVVHLILYVLWHRARHTAQVHLVRIQSLRLDENLMPVLIRELHDLILDGWTVARSHALDRSVIHRGTIDILTDDFVRLFVCIHEPAVDLRSLYLGKRRRVGERNHRYIALLHLKLREVQCTLVDTRRRSRLETKHPYPVCLQGIRQLRRCLEAIRTGMLDEITRQTAGVEIGSGTEDDGLRMIDSTGGRPDARHLLMSSCILTVCVTHILRDQFRDLRLPDQKMRLILEAFPHLIGIGFFICLCTQTVHRWSLRLIQHLRLQESLIDDLSHLTAERIQLTDEMSLRAATDMRITWHESDAVGTHRKYHGLQSETCRCESCLTSGMARPDDDHIISLFYY